MDLRRVVITGMGVVSPLACGVNATWNKLVSGESGATTISKFPVDNLQTKIACEVPTSDIDYGFNADDWFSAKDQSRVDPFITYAVAASTQAINDAGWEASSYEDQIRAGVLIGSGIGGLDGIAKTAVEMEKKGPRRVSPFFIPGRLINLASGYVSIKYGLKGPNHSVVTACSTGAHAIGDAARIISLGDADIMVAGGAESPICPIGIAGFNACRALSKNFNDMPEQASRPYDKDRDGFVMGEGAGVVFLEELNHALDRNANIYAEIVGYGLSGDAHHITAPSEDGDGGYRSMLAAIKRAGISPSEIDYINAHGTSTLLGDEIELRAVEKLLDGNFASVSMSSTKSSIGHLLGAAGAVEAIFSILAIRDNIVPPTINLDNPSIETEIDLVPKIAKERKVDIALSNSFGFGGTNASLVFKRFNA